MSSSYWLIAKRESFLLPRKFWVNPNSSESSSLLKNCLVLLKNIPEAFAAYELSGTGVILGIGIGEGDASIALMN